MSAFDPKRTSGTYSTSYLARARGRVSARHRKANASHTYKDAEHARHDREARLHDRAAFVARLPFGQQRPGVELQPRGLLGDADIDGGAGKDRGRRQSQLTG